MNAQTKASPSVLTWSRVVELARKGNVAPPRRVEKSNDQWRAVLTADQYDVARRKGTERPFSSELCALFLPGRYHCVCCRCGQHGPQTCLTTADQGHAPALAVALGEHAGGDEVLHAFLEIGLVVGGEVIRERLTRVRCFRIRQFAG